MVSGPKCPRRRHYTLLKVFKFHDGRKVYSKYKTIIPAKIDKSECYIQTEIVKEKIPLLLSK